MNKRAEYLELVDKRKVCQAVCRLALKNASRVKRGCWDCEEIGAYSQWQGNLNAKLMVVGQDFAGVKGFSKNMGWPGNSVLTNLMLVDFLKLAGISIRPPLFGKADDRIFFTNGVLCLKKGAMRGSIPDKYFRKCGKAFLRKTIEIVRPKVVVTLGTKALLAVNTAFNPEQEGRLPGRGGIPQATLIAWEGGSSKLVPPLSSELSGLE